MKILVVDDEQPIVEAIAYNLRKEGFIAYVAGDAGQCFDIVKHQKPDLIILDVMLPTASGFDICRTIRKTSSVPIIMLTARAGETDKVVGLEIGADDYITKPFSMRELIARVNAVLRRASATQDVSMDAVRAGDVVIDNIKHKVTVRGGEVVLAPREYDLLLFMASHPQQVFSRQQLLDRVWGDDGFVDDRTVDVHIRRLRKQIETDSNNPRMLLTVRGAGYKFQT